MTPNFGTLMYVLNILPSFICAIFQKAFYTVYCHIFTFMLLKSIIKIMLYNNYDHLNKKIIIVK